MKKLILAGIMSLVLALAASVVAQFTTNPASPRTLPGTATQGTVYATAFTNVNSIVKTADTNHLYVTGAGTAAANGAYTLLSNRVSGWVYTNSGGKFLVRDTRGQAGTPVIDWPFIIGSTTNNTDQSALYHSDGLFYSDWLVGTGVGPAPALMWGTNSTTNVCSFLVAYGESGKTFYVDQAADLTPAVATASAGDTIVVQPGSYTLTPQWGDGTTLLKNGVNWKFMPGAKLTYNQTGVQQVPATGPGYGIFDDRAIGAVTSNIEGDVFVQRSSNPLSKGLLYVKNAASRINLKANILEGAAYGLGSLRAVVNVTNCAIVTVEANQIFDISDSVQLIDISESNETFGTPIARSSTVSGVMWVEGNTYVRCAEMIATNTTAIWPASGGVFTKESSLYYDGDLLVGNYYTDASSTNARMWINIKLIDSTKAVTGFEVNPIEIYGAGKTYINAQKVAGGFVTGAGPYGIVMNGDGPAVLWVNIEKLSCSNSWIHMGVNSLAVGYPTLVAYIQELEEVGRINLGIEDSTPSGALTNSTLFLSGQRATCKGPFVHHKGGSKWIEGFHVDTSASTNPPAFTAAPFLSLKNMLLIGPGTTNSISAGSAQNVALYWSAANQAKHANVTLLPNAVLTVDANVK